MSLVHRITYQLPAADADGICLDQKLAGAGPLVLNGPLVQDGVFTSSILALEDYTIQHTRPSLQAISVTSTSDLTSVTLTMNYRARLNGPILAQTILGGNSETVVFTRHVAQVVSILADAKIDSNVSVGISSAATLLPISIGPKAFPVVVDLASDGTISSKLQHTLADIELAARHGVDVDYELLWLNYFHNETIEEAVNTHLVTHPYFDDTSYIYSAPVGAIRVLIDTYESSPTLTLQYTESDR